MTVLILSRFRLYIMMRWRTLREFLNRNVGAAIIVKGTLVATPQAKQPFEIQADESAHRGSVGFGLSAAEETSYV